MQWYDLDGSECINIVSFQIVRIYKMVDAATAEKLQAGFEKLASSDSKSLVKKYLTKEIFDQLKDKKTGLGATLLDCIQSGEYIR